ncbi:MAG: hypothetical protein V8R84_05425 [Eubacterium sp.]
MIFHSGGSLVCAKSCGAADRAEIPWAGVMAAGGGLSGGLCGTGGPCEGLRCCGLAEISVCGEAGGGQWFERWSVRNR